MYPEIQTVIYGIRSKFATVLIKENIECFLTQIINTFQYINLYSLHKIINLMF